MQDLEVEEQSNDTVENNNVDLPQEDIEDIEKAVEASVSASKAAQDKEDEDLADDDSEIDGGDLEEEDPKPESEDDDKVSDDDGELEADDDEVSDEQLEKAISLGVPIAEARKLGSDLLQTRIEGLEKAASSQDGDSADDESPSKDPLEGIPDLDPDIYDEELVEGFAALKKIVKDQSETISNMAKATSGDKALSGLESNAAKALKASPEKEAELKEKVEMLTAGYKATGKDVSSADVLAEAASSVLGEGIAKVAASEKRSAAQKRSGQKVSRATGGRGSTAKDVFEDAADQLDRKYFDKK